MSDIAIAASSLVTLIRNGDLAAATAGVRAVAENKLTEADRVLVIAALSDVLVNEPEPEDKPETSHTPVRERTALVKKPARTRPLRRLFTTDLCERALAGDKEAFREVKLRLKHKDTLQPQNRRALKATKRFLKGKGPRPELVSQRNAENRPTARKPRAPRKPIAERNYRSAANAFADRVSALIDTDAVGNRIRAHAMAKHSGWALADVLTLTDEDVLDLYNS